MFSIAALVPSPPMLVPALCGRGELPDGESDDPIAVLRAAALDAAAALAAVADRWTVLGVGADDQNFGPATRGTFRGFGADVVVGLGPRDSAPVPADPQLPLPVLIAGWLREQVAPEISVRARLLAADTAPRECARVGAALRAALDADPAPHAVLVVADGAATLTVKAPGYLDERAAPAQHELDAALRAGSRSGLAVLDPDLCARLLLDGRAAYQAMGGLFAGDPADPLVRTLYQGAPYGVAYDVSVWRSSGPEGSDE
ncbi:hypothetical protein BOX37_20775 [Nocardia mangyaensis]|uniref:Extradiol ring-cleavage dioxygenase class III enzyme subunit B domain-containing protein n=1 Tax=Nocardia mangyaensis TaxID=2213200 RepID=A0A1J0W316_9NOCA|nr:hypothetical protein [Nocardia mangyaensis]APE38567.1 hypothetical protein BOX37_20775 [Nocardia mangyaensis]